MAFKTIKEIFAHNQEWIAEQLKDDPEYFSKLSQTNPVTFELSDGAGKIVLRKTLGGSAHETVNLQGLSSGVYIAKIGTSEGNIFKKVVIE